MKMRAKLRKHSLKVLSVFLSLFLWAYVLSSEKVRFEKSVALEYVLPDDMIFAQRPPSEVAFAIRGPRAFVKTVNDREDRLVIDLNRSNFRRQQSFQVDINPAELSLPFGMVVERVSPRRIPIRLEQKASRIVPLKLQFTGQLPRQLSLKEYSLRPSEVEVYGPRSLVAELKALPVRPIELETLVGEESVKVDILLPDERLSLSQENEAVLDYSLKATGSNLVLKDLPIKFLGGEQDVSSETRRATVKLAVPEKILKSRSNVSSSVQVWADIPARAKGRIEIPLRVILAPGLLLLDVSPKSIIVNIR